MADIFPSRDAPSPLLLCSNRRGNAIAKHAKPTATERQEMNTDTTNPPPPHQEGATAGPTQPAGCHDAGMEDERLRSEKGGAGLGETPPTAEPPLLISAEEVGEETAAGRSHTSPGADGAAGSRHGTEDAGGGKDLTDSGRSAGDDDRADDSGDLQRGPAFPAGPGGPAPPPAPSHRNEDVTADSWRAHRKHVFVLSEAGKPIYSRYGNEEALSSTMGVMMALVSFVQDGNNVIRSIQSDDYKVVFSQQGPLVLVSVSRSRQSEEQLCRELLYVYYQIISMLTQVTVTRIFERKKNYDLRRLLAGSEKILDNLLRHMDSDPSFLLGAVQCVPLASSLREAVSQILQKAVTPNLVFSILVARGQLVAIVQERAVIEDSRLDPVDLHLLFNLLAGSSSFQAGEVWTPICLPRLYPDSYFYAYISYLDPACTLCLLLISTDKTAFYSVSACKRKIEEGLRSQALLQAIDAALHSHAASASHVGISDLWHFMYKPLDIPDNHKQLTQYTSPEFEAPYSTEQEKEHLFDLYQYLHSRIHSSARPLKLIYHVEEKETLLAWSLGDQGDGHQHHHQAAALAEEGGRPALHPLAAQVLDHTQPWPQLQGGQGRAAGQRR
ncbi:vacuolar fusion protein MON1 homolog A-like isoform X2 [Carcharodon carcharias]|uniref:vacuolar fusion protein MON1 homolog A-like isoform X2 n=1 Tax=Carcharodon carcharias TaxID=13397 RepID=UPI001B7E06DC|nr:vacuolar fusion protein MON1 homolog A-like isoform X2 [Carcharodon carcharias]